MTSSWFNCKIHQITPKLPHFPPIFLGGGGGGGVLCPRTPLAGLHTYGARTRASGPHLSGLELPSRTWNFLYLQVLRSCNFFNWISNTDLGQIWRFLEPCDLEIWRMTLKNNRAPLLSNIKLYASFHHHMRIQTGVTVRKRLSWVVTSVTLTFDLDLLHGPYFCH